jgi:3-phosphoglycerate kinase
MVGTFLKKSFHDVPLDGKTVLVRVDYNVPLSEDGTIMDDFRIQASLPTIHELIKRRCKIVLIAHLGRPDGTPNQKDSLEPVAHRLIELLQQPIKFVDDCVGDKVLQASKRLHAGEVLLLENLRFHAGEAKNDADFARQLALDSGADFFVQDGFGVAHRAQASTEGITHFLPSCAGLLLQKEYTALTQAMSSPKHPMTAILGGAKISDKISVIETFTHIADTIVIGGAIANTFLKYHGFSIGKSLYEEGLEETIDSIYAAAQQRTPDVHSLILLPKDVAVAKSLDKDAERKIVLLNSVEDDDYILDIGDATIEQYAQKISSAKTVVWSGTLGYAEAPAFAHGSARAALAIATAESDQISVVGGGDTVDFVLGWSGGDTSRFTHISSGGSASIELMSGMKLPGIEALMNK